MPLVVETRLWKERSSILTGSKDRNQTIIKAWSSRGNHTLESWEGKASAQRVRMWGSEGGVEGDFRKIRFS